MAGKKILVVDDDPHILELLAVNLTAAGYDVTTATNGWHALSKLPDVRPNLVIVDVMMPQMDGWELCKAIKDDPDTAAVKVLILTAKDTDRDRMIGKSILGADEYITKPFDVDRLMAAVEGLVRG